MTGFDVSLSRKENRMIDVTIYESGQKNKQINKEWHFCDFQQTPSKLIKLSHPFFSRLLIINKLINRVLVYLVNTE
jgi:hypothetical protein